MEVNPLCFFFKNIKIAQPDPPVTLVEVGHAKKPAFKAGFI
jgi:hypothetical protein